MYKYCVYGVRVLSERSAHAACTSDLFQLTFVIQGPKGEWACGWFELRKTATVIAL